MQIGDLNTGTRPFPSSYKLHRTSPAIRESHICHLLLLKKPTDNSTVYHLWQFADLEHRSAARAKSWSIEGWSDTVHKTVPLIQKMHSKIMVPMPWSPVG